MVYEIFMGLGVWPETELMENNIREKIAIVNRFMGAIYEKNKNVFVSATK
jgi:hypothetical protein